MSIQFHVNGATVSVIHTGQPDPVQTALENLFRQNEQIKSDLVGLKEEVESGFTSVTNRLGSVEAGLKDARNRLVPIETRLGSLEVKVDEVIEAINREGNVRVNVRCHIGSHLDDPMRDANSADNSEKSDESMT
jgi:predicted  nucleic acid-binding Zn-ribbon protein